MFKNFQLATNFLVANFQKNMKFFTTDCANKMVNPLDGQFNAQI